MAEILHVLRLKSMIMPNASIASMPKRNGAATSTTDTLNSTYCLSMKAGMMILRMARLVSAFPNVKFKRGLFSMT